MTNSNITLCPICYSEGKILYKNLSDRQFGAVGSWNVFKCGKCLSLFIDPRPSDDEIIAFYKNYHTHTNKETKTQETVPPKNLISKLTPLKRLLKYSLKLIRNSLLNKEYQYHFHKDTPISKYAYLLSYLNPSWRDTQLANVYYFKHKDNSRLLDVGCGNGDSLYGLGNLGFATFGCDLDAKAVENARRLGANVAVGDLRDIKYPDNKFDRILYNHVIEHTREPLETLMEIHRVLNYDGQLVITTPNSLSLGHSIFKENWRGLETPQHLQIFSPQSLKKVCLDAGFKKVTVFSSWQGSPNMLEESLELSKNRQINFGVKLTNPLWQTLYFILGFVYLLFKNRNEMLVAICYK